MSAALRTRLRGLPLLRPDAVLLGVLILVLLGRMVLMLQTDEPPIRDAEANVQYAARLATTGTMAEAPGVPTMYREPLPVAFLALQIRLDPRLDGVDGAALARPGPEIVALKQQNALWAGLLLLGVALQARRLVPPRARTAVAAGAVLLVHAVAVEPVADVVLTELHAATLIVWAGLAGQRLVERRTLLAAVGLGLLIGAAALTKGSILYIGLVHIVGLVALMLLRQHADRRRVLVAGLVAVVAVGAVVLPWMGRNAAEFGTWSIADRSGFALWNRAIYAEATPRELDGSWYAFTPDALKPLVGPIVDVTDEDLMGELRRAHRFHPDEPEELLSFHGIGRRLRVERTDAYLAAGGLTRAEARLLADADFLDDALHVLREDPWFFVATAPMFLWRGTWMVLAAPLVPRIALGLLNPFAMLALLVAGLGAVVRGSPRWFAVVGIPTGVVAFSALFTLYEPRYSEPALPTMLILLVVGATHALLRIRGRMAGAQRTSPDAPA